MAKCPKCNRRNLDQMRGTIACELYCMSCGLVLKEEQSPTIYERNGYNERETYLAALATEYDVKLEYVKIVAYVLGPDEDFDGLIVMIEDHLVDN